MSNISITSLFPFRRVKIEDFSQIIDPDNGMAMYTTVSPDFRFNPICHECGSEADSIHSWHQRILRDLNFGSNPGLMIYKYRKIVCSECGSIKVEQLDVTNPGGSHVTNRMAKYIHELCKLMPVEQVAKHLKLDWKTVKNIDKRFLEEEFGETDYSNSGYLAIDEISMGKYHKYLTVILDFITGRVIWVGKDRKTLTLDKFFQDMPKNDLKNIKAVAMDMWDPFIKSVLKWCPNACIVFDKFHIISNFNDVIDSVRRNEQRDKSLSEKEQKVIKGSRWMLLKNEDNLKDKEIPKLEKLLELNVNLSKVYILKDQLKMIWTADTLKDMEKALDNWCIQALQTELKPVTKFVNMLQKHRYGILAYVNHPIHTSKLEGTNNRIKELKRRAYGYHDLEYYKLKIKQAFPGN
jgi:transposase